MKKLLLLASATFLSAGAYAGDVKIDSDDLTMQLLGRFQFQSGYTKQSKSPGLDNTVSNNRKNFGFNTNAYVGTKITAEKDEMKYGAVLALSTSTRGTGSPSYSRSHIFVETNAGKLELGSNFSSSGAMAITAFEIASATGGDGTDYVGTFERPTATNGKTPISGAPMYPSMFLDYNLDKYSRESSRKVTYYTPELGGFQVGVSFIPDSGNLGVGSLKDTSDDYNSKTNDSTVTTGTAATGTTTKTYSEKKPVKDAYTVGLSYKRALSDTVSLKLSAVGEYGKPVKNSGQISTVVTPAAVPGGAAPTAAAPVITNYKLAKLSSYNVGGVLTLGNYAIGASYTNLGKSLTSAEVNGSKRTTKSYAIGASYTQGPAAVSLIYSKANQYGNKMDVYTLGTDYKLAPGFLPYAEIAYFNGKSSPLAVYNDTTKTKFKGWVYILGAKLAF